jgi:signal transduction histidine kinase
LALPSHLLAWLVAGASIAAGIAAVVLLATRDIWDLPPGPQVLVDATVGMTSPAIALVILQGRRTGRGTRMLAWVLLGSGAAEAATALATAAALAATTSTASVEALVQLQSWLWVPGFMPLLTLLPLLYPDGLLRGLRWRLAAAAAGLGTVLFAAGVALHPETFHGKVDVTKPLVASTASEVLAPLGAVLLVPATGAAVVSLVLRLRRTEGLARRQVVVFLVAAGILLAVTALQGVIPAPADVLAQAAAVALLPAAIGVAVTRHRLYELDTAVCRALVAASLTVCLIGLYLSLLALVDVFGGGRSTFGLALAAALTGAVLQPMGRRLSAGVDRLYYGDRADPYLVTSGLASRLAAPGLDIGDVPHVVCKSVVESLRLGAAEVRVLVDGVERSLARAGGTEDAGRGQSEQFALRHRGETAGWLVVVPRPGESRVEPADRDLLAAIADLAAPAIDAIRLHQQLQRGRELLVSAHESERLRLRRELHDGLGATLAGLRLQVESAHAMLDGTPAGDLLAAAGASIRQAVGEVRAISEGLRPPGIDDLGLGSSLALLAERVERPGLDVEVRVDDMGALDPATEVAAYRIASEALANAVRHARASRIGLTVTVADELLRVAVVDDGVGLSARADDPGSGLGLSSMRVRAEEIGGRLELVSGPDGVGTSLVALLPRHVEAGR